MYIALFKDGRYYKTKVEEGHIVSYDDSLEKFVEIYDVWQKSWYGTVLTENSLSSLNIPNLGYIRTSEGYQVYDKTKEEYIEELLPVYVDVFGSIKLTNKKVALKIPTRSSVQASKEIFQKVLNELISLKQQKDINFIHEKIEKGNGIAYININENYIYDISSVVYSENANILFSSKGHYVIGKVAKNHVLDLYVPQSIAPMIIGKKGQNIKKISENVGAKRINVKVI